MPSGGSCQAPGGVRSGLAALSRHGARPGLRRLRRRNHAGEGRGPPRQARRCCGRSAAPEAHTPARRTSAPPPLVATVARAAKERSKGTSKPGSMRWSDPRFAQPAAAEALSLDVPIVRAVEITMFRRAEPAQPASHRALETQPGVDQGAEREQAQPRLAVGVVLVGLPAGARGRAGPFGPVVRVIGVERGPFEKADGGSRASRTAPSASRAATPSSAGLTYAKTLRGSAITASPSTPPRPVGSGQCAVTGQHGGDTGGADRAEQQQQQARRRSRQPALCEQAPGPEHGWHQHRESGDAEDLHYQVGDDRAVGSERIMDVRRRRVIEAGIDDRPGHQRHGERRKPQEERGADEFGHATYKEDAHRLRNVVEGRRAGRRAHPGPLT